MAWAPELDFGGDRLPRLDLAEDKEYENGIERILGDISRQSTDGALRRASTSGGSRNNHFPETSYQPMSHGVVSVRVNKRADEGKRPRTFQGLRASPPQQIGYFAGQQTPNLAERSRRFPRAGQFSGPTQQFAASNYSALMPHPPASSQMPLYSQSVGQSVSEPSTGRLSPPRTMMPEGGEGKEMVSTGVQVAPLPWNRFFFPDRKQLANKDSQNPFFEYLDVCIPTKFSAEDKPQRVVVEDVPAFLKKEWTKLYYMKDMHSCPAKNQWPVVNMYESKEIISQDSTYWAHAHHDNTQIMQLEDFCEFVCRLEPRSGRDSEALQDLRCGLLFFLSKQIRTAAEDSAELYHAKEVRLMSEMEKRVSNLSEKMHSEMDEVLDRHKVKDESRARLYASMTKMNTVMRKTTTDRQEDLLMVSKKNAQELKNEVAVHEAESGRLAEAMKGTATIISDLKEEYETRIADLEDRLADQDVSLLDVTRKWEWEQAEKVRLTEKVRCLEPRARLGERAEEYFAKMMEAQRDVDQMRAAMRKRTTEIMQQQTVRVEAICQQFDDAKKELDGSAAHLLKGAFIEQQQRMQEVEHHLKSAMNLEEEQKSKWFEERKKVVTLNEQVGLLQSQLSGQAADIEAERKKNLLRMAQVKREMAKSVMEAYAVAQEHKGSYGEDMTNELQEEVMSLFEDKTNTEEALVSRMEQMQEAEEEAQRNELKAKLEAKQRSLHYEREMASLKLDSDMTKQAMLARIQADMTHIEALESSMVKIDDTVMQAHMSTVTAQETEKLTSQRLNDKMREMEDQMGKMNKIEEDHFAPHFKSPLAVDSKKDSSRVTNAAMTLSMAGQAADGLQKALALRANTASTPNLEMPAASLPEPAVSANVVLMQKLKLNIKDLSVDLKVARTKLGHLSKQSASYLTQLTTIHKLLIRGTASPGEDTVRAAANKVLESLSKMLEIVGAENGHSKGINMFRRVAKMTLQGIKIERLTLQLRGSRKRQPLLTADTKSTKEIMAMRLRGVPFHVAEAARVLSPLGSKDAAKILTVMPPHHAAEMLWLYTLSPEDIAEVLSKMHTLDPMNAASVLKAMTEERRNQILDVCDPGLVAELKAEQCMSMQAPVFEGLTLGERAVMLADLEPITAIEMIGALHSEGERRKTMVGLDPATRAHLAAQCAMQCSDAKMAMLLPALPEKEQTDFMNVYLDSPARTAAVLEKVAVPLAGELLQKLATDERRVQVLAAMSFEKGELILAEYCLGVEHAEGVAFTKAVRVAWDLNGYKGFKLAEDDTAKVARLTIETEIAQMSAVEKDSELQTSALWKEGLVNQLAEAKGDLEVLQGQQDLETDRAKEDLADARLRTDNQENVEEAEKALEQLERKQHSEKAEQQTKHDVLGRELRRAVEVVSTCEEELTGLTKEADALNTELQEIVARLETERQHQMDQIIQNNNKMLEDQKLDVETFGRSMLIVAAMKNITPMSRGNSDFRMALKSIEGSVSGLEAVNALKAAETLFELRADAIGITMKALKGLQGEYKEVTDIPEKLQSFVSNSDLALSRVLTVEDSTLAALQNSVMKLVAALYMSEQLRKDLQHNLGVIKSQTASRKATFQARGSEFMQGLMNRMVVKRVKKQKSMEDICRQALQFLKETFNVDGMLTEISYDTEEDGLGSDDPNTYDDNVFCVRVAIGEFAGWKRFQVQEGNFLTQEPKSLEYRAANGARRIYEGECMAYPLVLPQTATQTNIFGQVWGCVILHGCDVRSFSDAESDLSILFNSLVPMLVNIISEQDSHFDHLHMKLDKYTMERTMSYRQLGVMSGRLGVQGREDEVRAQIVTESGFDIKFLQSHREKIEKLLQSRTYMHMLLELKRYRSASPVITGVVSCIILMTDRDDYEFRRLLKNGLPATQNALQEVWSCCRKKLNRNREEVAGGRLVTASIVSMMVKYVAKLNSTMEEYVNATMARFTRGQIKKASKVMSVLTDWIICVQHMITLKHIEMGDPVEKMIPFQNTLSQEFEELEGEGTPRGRRRSIISGEDGSTQPGSISDTIHHTKPGKSNLGAGAVAKEQPRFATVF